MKPGVMKTDSRASAMTLTGDGVELSLGVLGYQYPDEIDYWDGNWLIIDGAVTHPQGSWRFRDACLTSFELQQLAEWLNGVARGIPDPNSGYFTEPCLEFRYASEPEPMIDVIVTHECAPPWLGTHEERMQGTRLSFPLSVNDPQALSDAVRGLLEQFPIRYAA